MKRGYDGCEGQSILHPMLTRPRNNSRVHFLSYRSARGFWHLQACQSASIPLRVQTAQGHLVSASVVAADRVGCPRAALYGDKVGLSGLVRYDSGRLTGFLPLDITLDVKTVRHATLKVAERYKAELGELCPSDHDGYYAGCYLSGAAVWGG